MAGPTDHDDGGYADAKARRLDEASSEVARRLVGAMDTVAEVLRNA